ncbi:unnamed protein product [Prunus armeniaca]|uniref:E3 ubiquitin protein ligase n=1 Tax=Prunus armeniaca TaxID=36596 RepID=A0A6J5Y1Z0_PRUAR|nr:unnamed protein product [Prunus armeniaca]CAB4318427.1 unnamed protein product [Prunus armeniaca]
MRAVDAAVLQYQNQRLLQQIDKQKHDLQDVEAKIEELKDKQESNGNDEIAKYVEEALPFRHTSTRELLKLMEHAIYSHREKTESIVHTLDGKTSSEDAIIQLPKIDDMMEREVKNQREAIDILHMKQKEYADVIRTYLSGQSTDQSEIRRITGELDDSMTELEESRRKLVNLKMQKDVASGMQNLTSDTSS